MTIEEMGHAIYTALAHDAGVSAQAIGLYAKTLQYWVDEDGQRLTLEDVSGLDEDQEAIEELLDAGFLVVLLPESENEYESVLLPEDPRAQHAASAEDAIDYLYEAA